MYYKDSQNKLHFIDSDSEARFLPADAKKITDAEAEQILLAERKEFQKSLTYVEKRKMEYPALEEQFDLLYHGGYDAWREAIQAVKNKYPKE